MSSNLSNLRTSLVTIIVSIVAIPSLGAQSTSVHQEALLGRHVSEALQGLPLLTDTVYNDLTDYAMKDLLNTPGVKQSRLPYQWEWFVVDAPDTVNAAAYLGGKIMVSSGLSKALGSQQGLWAAVLGHEIGHSLYRHHVLLFERRLAQQRLRNALDDTRSSRAALWMFLGNIGYHLLDLKLSRDEESQADEAGLFLLAQAGYPPDFGVLLHRVMYQKFGEQSAWEVFFKSDHPRDTTREDRTYKSYRKARDVYLDYLARGGKSKMDPPAWARVEELKIRKGKESETPGLFLSAQVVLHNAQSRDLEIVVFFRDESDWVKSALPEYSSQNGDLFISQRIFTNESLADLGSVSMFLPDAAVRSTDRGKEVKVHLFVTDSGNVLGSSEPEEMKFLK